MTSPPEPNLVDSLSELIQEALKQREDICRDLKSVFATERSLYKSAAGLGEEPGGRIPYQYPIQIPPGSDLEAAVVSVKEGLALLTSEHDAYIGHGVAWAEAERSVKSIELKVTEAAAGINQLKSRCFGINFLQKIFIGGYERKLLTATETERACHAEQNAAQHLAATANSRFTAAGGRREEVKTAFLALLEKQQTSSRHFFDSELSEGARQWSEKMASVPPFFLCDWEEGTWKDYNLTRSYRVPFWVSGMVDTPDEHGLPRLKLPCLVPLIGRRCVTIIKGEAGASESMMQGLVLQLAAMLPHSATFSLLDPSGAGRAFPMQRGLPYTRPSGVDSARDMEAVFDDIGRIIRSYLDAETQSFEFLPDEIQANERYEFIIAANFPHGYDRRAIEILQKVGKNGPVAGKYLFLQMAAGAELPNDLKLHDFGDVITVDADRPACPPSIAGGKIFPLRAAAGQAQNLILARLAAAKAPESNVQWANLTESDPAKWWTENATNLIQSPVGSSGRDRMLNLWFGVSRDGRPCAHGILGAMPGSGKSNLYHVFICGLAIRYGPEELNFYLIDGKMGVEFQPYRRLPHARVVALNSAPELSRSVLGELLAEMERRNELFGSLGVVDLPGYKALGQPCGPRARIILMIDEYQELFEDDRHQQASAQLLALAQQGRSAGIHLLLCSQRFGAAGMMNQAAIFGSIHLRLAMRMSLTDVQGLTEFGRNGKRLVEQCDLPGKIVVNANSGDDNSNEFGKIALMTATERSSVIDALVDKAQREWPAERRFATVVFDGREQPNFAENPQVIDLARHAGRPSAAEWHRIATSPAHERGLGVSDWYAGERPLALWLGQELTVHGQARIILRHRGMENILIVGENSGPVYGMLASMLASLVLNASPAAVRIWLGDRALPGTPWEGLLEEVSSRLLDPFGYDLKRGREPRTIIGWFSEWREELERRQALDEAELQNQPSWILMLAGLERIPQLAKTTSEYGSTTDSPDGESLRILYTRGPALGLHVILASSSVGALKQCLDRGQLEQFKHRVATQMGENDSFLLLGNDQAAKLQRAGACPVFAIYGDQTAGGSVKFKPYTLEAQMPWPLQLDLLAEHLERWKGLK